MPEADVKNVTDALDPRFVHHLHRMLLVDGVHPRWYGWLNP